MDVGRSYQGIAEQYTNSQFIDFGKTPDFTLNPFAFLTDITVNDDVFNEAPEFTGESTSTMQKKTKLLRP
ncbi:MULTISPECIES: hypothetical protein [Enterobacteriaceae]|uniref:hypothetical protein n=1 Tax=Enterobacteriaceae TaxID=543 RepID=UPI00254B95B7|nr:MULTISPECIES: hypothetical protein [Enterobacteriaceae]